MGMVVSARLTKPGLAAAGFQKTLKTLTDKRACPGFVRTQTGILLASRILRISAISTSS